MNTDATLTTWPVVGALICWPFRYKCQHGDSRLVCVVEKNEVTRLWNAYRNRGIELIEQVAQQFWVNAGSQRIGFEAAYGCASRSALPQGPPRAVHRRHQWRWPQLGLIRSEAVWEAIGAVACSTTTYAKQSPCWLKAMSGGA